MLLSTFENDLTSIDSLKSMCSLIVVLSITKNIMPINNQGVTLKLSNVFYHSVYNIRETNANIDIILDFHNYLWFMLIKWSKFYYPYKKEMTQ